ncbi:hypothetical protein [Allorhizocola rhizosphaerae]|uniref:hypothetical protein n=1 Tax=Allorhizocola rhizosphaerae TaxID=1872709 RepID=UPI0013C35AD0|nr:hypothetical protein [Allorhizocola rhizosphaerae]
MALLLESPALTGRDLGRPASGDLAHAYELLFAGGVGQLIAGFTPLPVIGALREWFFRVDAIVRAWPEAQVQQTVTQPLILLVAVTFVLLGATRLSGDAFFYMPMLAIAAVSELNSALAASADRA